MFAPERGVENPIIRRALGLCEANGMKVIYHEDTVEVWFAPTNKRFYTVWSQFLADAEAIFGEKMHAEPVMAEAAAAPLRNGFGHRAEAAPPPAAHAANGAANGAANTAASAAAEPELARLRHELKVLERAIRVVGVQREEWKKEAESLKEQLAETRQQVANMLGGGASVLNPTASGTDRYKALRGVVVRRLHPDIPGTDEEKSYRDKLFKQIWKEVELLDKK